jgi:phosphatidylglycerophosphatase A
MKRWLILWIAQGFGSGRLKPGPGTWGSLVGVLWMLLLLSSHSIVAFIVGTLAAIALAVPVCGRAANLLGKPDPGSVVLDEIVALPLVALPWLLADLRQGSHGVPLMGHPHRWALLVAGFVLFRILDIAKPWPIRPLQNLHGGLGIVADDLAAGLIAGLILLAGRWL